MDDADAIQWVRGTIRAEMTRRRLTYADVAQRLRALGVDENEKNVANKVARGTFSAVFFVQCLEAIGVTEVRPNMLKLKRMKEDIAASTPEGYEGAPEKKMAQYAVYEQNRQEADENARRGE